MRRRWGAVLLGLSVLVIVLGLLTVPVAPEASAADAGSARTVTGTARRMMIAKSGAATTVDARHVSMTVSQTRDLRGEQMIDVSWKGAHPTGGIVGDPNSSTAADEEYPFVLMECRGTARTITPETCWTQTSSERFQTDSGNEFPAWRSDAFARASDRKLVVGAPKKVPSACGFQMGATRWVPFRAENGTAYYGGGFGCAGMAPEASNITTASAPSNTTYGITGASGAGSSQFAVWSADDNASLGCSATVPCALVAVPIEGISCDPYGTRAPRSQRPAAWQRSLAVSACEGTPLYAAGAPHDSGVTPNLAVTGSLWWSASNWRNRLTVPLSFAVSASVCGVVNDLKPLQAYGSVNFTDIAAQWEPTFCTSDSYSPFVQVQTSDVSARGLLDSGNIDVALGTQPVADPSKDVQAPIALSGFAISYNIDGTDGQPYTSLRLDARLVAKLLSESYPAMLEVQQNDKALSGNPINITADPEFRALDPGIPRQDLLQAAATMITLSSDSDMMWALTSWINADPEARAWLDGTPDPWGMVVNPSYQGIELPVTTWPLLDTWEPPQSYLDSGANPCYAKSPAPYLNLVANPTAMLTKITQDLEFGMSNVGTACPNPDPTNPTTLILSTEGRQVPGHRFVIGLTPLTSVARYSFHAAALQTSSDVTPGKTFADASDRTFVSPDDAALKAAAALLEADPDTGTWNLPYDELHAAVGDAAYPGTMPIYADVPVKGLGSTTAAQAAQLLSYAATRGQAAGTANGELPPGALPLTSDEGLGDLAGYTLCAADAVLAQKGTVPALDKTSGCTPVVPSKRPTSDGSTPPSASPTPGTGTPSSPGVGTTPPSGGTGVPPGAAPSVASAPTSAPAAAEGDPSTVVTAEVRTVGSYSALGRFGLPTAAIAGLLMALAGVLLRWGGDVAVVVRALTRRVARR